MEFTNPFAKNKKSQQEMILDLEVQLRRLEDQYKIIINRELRALRYSRKNHSENPRAVNKIKHAYYGLGVIRQAQENLRDVRTTNDLFATMNEMGTALKALNRISNSTERPRSGMIDRQIKKMDKNAARRDGGMENVLPTSIHQLVSDDVVERLMSGDSINDCLCQEGDAFVNMPFTSDMLADLEGMGVADTGLEADLNSTMAFVQALEDEF